MGKKFIGIEISEQVVRTVTAEAVKGVPVLNGAEERLLESPENRPRVLAEALGEVSFGDVVAAILPAVGGFYRLIELPFGEAKKIEPALPLEMSSQVPVSDELICDFLAATPQEKSYLVPAAAVRRAAVLDLLALFQQAGQPLHLLDLSPFGFAAGLAGLVPEGILAVVLRSEITLACVSGGKVRSFRNIPVRGSDPPDRVASLMYRNYLGLEHPGNNFTPPLYLIGEGAGEELCRALTGVGITPRYPELELAGKQLAPALMPAAALALRAALPARQRQFNFIKDDLAPKSQWAGFRSQLITAAVLLGLSTVTASAGAYFNYSHKQALAESLREQTIAVFRETFPQARVVDAPVQMRNSLAELQEKARLLGLGRDLSALSVLREVSARIPREVTVDVREMIYSGDQLRLDGTTTTFEAINRLAQSLEGSPSFEQVQIADAKTGLEGSRVDFRLNLKISEEGAR